MAELEQLDHKKQSIINAQKPHLVSGTFLLPQCLQPAQVVNNGCAGQCNNQVCPADVVSHTADNKTI